MRRVAGAACGRRVGARAAVAVAVTVTSAMGGFGTGCAGTPWLLGEPLDNRQVIPPTTRTATAADHRRRYEQAHARREKTVEIAELIELERLGALHVRERQRLADLLRERARDWAALKRPIPLAEDLRHLVELDPARAQALTPALRSAERAAGDVWLAIGDNARAEEEYRRAEVLGAGRMIFRFRAAWGASPGDLEKDVLERALAELPERALAPFSDAYLKGGGAQPRLLRRAWTAARVWGPPSLEGRLAKAAMVPPPSETPPSETPPSETPIRSSAEGPADGAADAELLDDDPNRGVLSGPAPLTVLEPAAGDRLIAGPTLARVLLPLAAAFPELAAPGLRSREWADRLIAEDPTSPDSLELAALIDARAGRLDGAASKLVDMVFYSSDRAGAYERAARVWQRVGQARRACHAWERSARAGAVDDPRWCELLACARRTPGSGDVATMSVFIRTRAPALACVAEPGPGPTPPSSPPPPPS